MHYMSLLQRITNVLMGYSRGEGEDPGRRGE